MFTEFILLIFRLLYGENIVSIFVSETMQSDVAKVYVYVHGGNCKIESEGNVMVRYKKNGD